MQDLADLHLDTMSTTELQELKAEVHVAIRAAIRLRSELKSKLPEPAKMTPAKVDLERERDAWIASRKQATLR